ncbi:NAD-dependent epimerase/dehydratase family protein [Phytohabitans rumicis]|uniref:NAD-dependent dehydratase n=1 Tax=Phytohabitans rumicis TaxID=1076125 RepID=A0A6V8L482_9ACTN|nr:NAD(P)-dependent oxidoreductase [Phytohabitans rumicis]GFJ92062.1 NAD-dependent dehydratase [Phytohabitans rumicis]
MSRLLVTGAAGRIGALLRPQLVRPDRELRLLDLAPQRPAGPGEIVIQADITDPGAMARACDGADAVLHLAAYPGEQTWAELQRVNVDGTRTLLEAARGAGVPRVILASSMHAAGFHPRTDGPLPAAVPARPDTYYGWSKAAAEALGTLYADRFGMTVFAVRIGACFPTPLYTDLLHCWLAPDDCVRLVEACLAADTAGFRLLWGISRNTRRWWSLSEGEEIGYHPQLDSEEYAQRLGPAPERQSSGGDRLGGYFCFLPLGEPY